MPTNFAIWTRTRYQFVSLLAEGGFARIFLALDVETGESVAIKQAKHKRSAHKLREEAELLRKLPKWRVPGTPRLLDCFEENGRVFLVQEYLEGPSLGYWQRQKPRLPTFFDIYARLAHAVQRLHEAGFIHRDLKPQNVLLVKGRPYLLDFGLSAHGWSEAEDEEGSEYVLGTPLYMPPEMISGSTQPTGSADVFSLGVMLYEGLTASLPFNEHGRLRNLLFGRALDDLSRHVRFPDLELPATVVEIFRTMLSLVPADRPPISEVTTALHAAAALVRLRFKTTTIPLPVPAPGEQSVHSVAAPSLMSGADLHRAALRIAELEAHLERTTKLTESVAILVKDLGDKLNPEVFQAMVRESVLVSMRDIEMPHRFTEVMHTAQELIGHLIGNPERGSGKSTSRREISLHGGHNHRSLDQEPSPRAPIKHPILFLAANPSGTDRRALEREARAIQLELERSGFRDRFELVTRWATEPLDVLRELRKLKPTVVHFSGYGAGPASRRNATGEPSHDDDASRHGLFFQGPDGRPQLVSTAALEETFSAAGASVKVVVLSACYSEVQARALLLHVGCVVGMSGARRSAAARTFVIGFYGGLGECESVAAAYKQGCAAISLEGLRDQDRPQLAVRADVDVSKLILAADPVEP